MQKLYLMVYVFVIVCIYSGVSYGNDAHKTDAQIMEEMILEIKKLHMYEDRETLNINEFVKTIWYQNGASIVIIPLDSNALFEKRIHLLFHYIFEGYGRGGRKSHTGERFIKQINKKLSEGIPLINFIQKDLIATFEYADGDKVIFDAYYNEIKYFGNIPHRED